MNKFNWVDKNNEVLHDKYQWFAVDKNGLSHVFTKKPALFDIAWHTNGPDYWVGTKVYFGVAPDVDWQLSLIERDFNDTKVSTSFNWHCKDKKLISYKHKWFAINSDNTGWVFSEKPTLFGSTWMVKDGYDFYVGQYSTLDYRSSLINRYI